MLQVFVGRFWLIKLIVVTFILSSVLSGDFSQALGALEKSRRSMAMNQSIVIGLIDTGVDIDHKFLKESIWTNLGETGPDSQGRDKATNGVDDDGNGFVDDIHGWNFVDNTNKVFDENGHGTHIAGIIKKQFDHSSPAKNFNIKFMILKFYDAKAKGEQSVLNSVRAINYAIKMRALIINYSAGGEAADEFELQAIQKALAKNIFLIAAAGNSHVNTDFAKFYPASYNLSNIITVASIDKNARLSPFSNFGMNSVDIAAPGSSILSTVPKNGFEFLSGTSQATAFVTGRLASVMSFCFDCTRDQQKSYLFSKAKKVNSLKGLTKTQLALVED